MWNAVHLLDILLVNCCVTYEDLKGLCTKVFDSLTIYSYLPIACSGVEKHRMWKEKRKKRKKSQFCSHTSKFLSGIKYFAYWYFWIQYYLVKNLPVHIADMHEFSNHVKDCMASDKGNAYSIIFPLNIMQFIFFSSPYDDVLALSSISLNAYQWWTHQHG